MHKKILCLCLILWSTIALADVSVGGFASLKKKQVNWRTGPGERYPIQWVYQEQGYPVKVLDSYDIWRQVQEADGSIGWVHKNMLTDKRTVLVQEEGTLLHKPDVSGRPVAVVEPGTIGRIVKCPAEQEYCLLVFRYQGKEVKGWLSRAVVWGLVPSEEID